MEEGSHEDEITSVLDDQPKIIAKPQLNAKSQLGPIRAVESELRIDKPLRTEELRWGDATLLGGMLLILRVLLEILLTELRTQQGPSASGELDLESI